MIGWTLARYLSVRFLQTIGAVFLMISGMIYVVDFIELLRRTGDIPGVSAGYIAYFSFLRVPSVSEQIMPFCVLFGTMATFLNLTRTLELLVARAVGVSVWGFLVPPLAIAAATGIGSVVLFNPVSAAMKNRADVIETQLFGRNQTTKRRWRGFHQGRPSVGGWYKAVVPRRLCLRSCGNIRTKDRGASWQTLARCIAIRQGTGHRSGRKEFCH
jgi:lipopolysaccharide export LptBFGC system permease protein LptF